MSSEAEDATLTQVEQNAVSKLIVESGPPIDGFRWSVMKNAEFRSERSVNRSPYTVSCLRHEATGYYCIFGAHTITLCPGFKKKIEIIRHEDEWESKLVYCRHWLITVRCESEAPDLFKSLLDASHIHLEQAKSVAAKLTGEYINNQIQRLEDSARKDPELAIGTAKEFLETLCRTILRDRTIPVAKDEDLAALVRITIRNVKVVPDGLNSPGTEKTVTILLNNLGSIAHQLAEIRNAHGTGHGKTSEHVGLVERHARLAVGMAVTLAVFLYDCHQVG
jgi:hypothetical protein